MRAWAKASNLEVVHDEIYEGTVQQHMRQRSGVMNVGFGTLGAVSRALTFGKLDLGLSDCVFIVRKP